MPLKVQTARGFQAAPNDPEPLLPFPQVQRLRESKLGPEIWVLGVQLRKRGVQVYRVRNYVEFRRPRHSSVKCSAITFRRHGFKLLREVLAEGETIERVKAEMDAQIERLPALRIRERG